MSNWANGRNPSRSQSGSLVILRRAQGNAELGLYLAPRMPVLPDPAAPGDVPRARARMGGHRFGVMDVNEPGLFDMPDRESATSPGRLQRGENRETWVRTVTAEVDILDAEALREAALQVEESGLTIGLSAGLNLRDTVAEADLQAAGYTFEKLAWLIWPTDGLEGPLAAGAFRILSVDSAAVAESDDRGILMWTVVVKLTNVQDCGGSLPRRTRRRPS